MFSFNQSVSPQVTNTSFPPSGPVTIKYDYNPFYRLTTAQYNYDDNDNMPCRVEDGTIRKHYSLAGQTIALRTWSAPCAMMWTLSNGVD